jgi:hypothetical protein
MYVRFLWLTRSGWSPPVFSCFISVAAMVNVQPLNLYGMKTRPASIEQCVLDTNAGKQLSYAAIDV